MGGHIDVYVDIVSLYSYLGFVLLRRDLPLYAANGIEVVYHPVLLGGINKASGNQPPFMLPAKAKYGVRDAARSCARAGVPNTSVPPTFLARARTLLVHFDTDTLVAAIHYLFFRFWTAPHADLHEPDGLRAVLAAAPRGFNGDPDIQSPPLFTAQQAGEIVAGLAAQPIKDRLAAATAEAVERGAFGAPWFWVRNDAGEEAPFFGSDRFHFIYQFLGLPYRDLALLPSASAPPKL